MKINDPLWINSRVNLVSYLVNLYTKQLETIKAEIQKEL